MNISDFALSYQKSPIILTNGIAKNMPGGLLPIISLTQSENFKGGVLGASSGLKMDQFLFDFFPLPGGTLIDNQVGLYPFANQTVASNAIITQPLRVSLLMMAPVRPSDGGYARKLSVFQSLKRSLDQHIAAGGTFTVATPAYFYVSGLLLALRDVSTGDEKKPQSAWSWDFMFPLLTLAQAQQAQNSLMQKISSGAEVRPNLDGSVSYSGQDPAVGSPSSGVSPSVVPAAKNTAGSSTNSPSPPPAPRFL